MIVARDDGGDAGRQARFGRGQRSDATGVSAGRLDAREDFRANARGLEPLLIPPQPADVERVRPGCQRGVRLDAAGQAVDDVIGRGEPFGALHHLFAALAQLGADLCHPGLVVHEQAGALEALGRIGKPGEVLRVDCGGRIEPGDELGARAAGGLVEQQAALGHAGDAYSRNRVLAGRFDDLPDSIADEAPNPLGIE